MRSCLLLSMMEQNPIVPNEIFEILFEVGWEQPTGREIITNFAEVIIFKYGFLSKNL